MDDKVHEFIATAIFGLVFAGPGIGFLIHSNWKKRRCTEQTEGVVVGSQLRTGSAKRGTGIYAIFSITVDGAEYKLLHTRGYSPLFPKYKEGDKATIFYNPNKPEQFYLKADRFSHVGPMLFSLIIGSGIIALAFYLLFA